MNTEANPDDLLTPREVAAILRCNPRTVGNYREEGKLKAERHSLRTYRYRRSDVEAFRNQARGDTP